MTKNYTSPTAIPFTSAGSDYQKLIQSAESFVNKKDLIDFAATDFASLRDSLIAYMQAVYPTDYQNFSESDFGMMFTELVAYMGAVMSFKADAIANENFLSTAKNRRNIRKLLQLIGINMKGPTSSAANALFLLDSAAAADFYISPTDRNINISSPFDGGNLEFTLYKTSNGKVSAMGANTTRLDLLLSESDSELGLQWTNLALLEGTMIEETAVFNSTQVFKTITLTQSPVIEKSVQIYVDDSGSYGGDYIQVENVLTASGPSDRVFDVTYDSNYTATIRFGDGVVGSSPPNDSAYRVLYRVGGGTRGNILGSTINSPITTSTGITGTISNSSVATGGQDAETIENAKKYGPLAFKQQDRLVTLGDFKSYIHRYTSPSGGRAIGTAITRKAYSSANIIDLYVLQKATEIQLQRATVEYKVNLLSDLQAYKMLTDDVHIVDGLIRTLDLVITIYCDQAFSDLEESLKMEAAGVITSYFSYTAQGFGDSFAPQDLNRKLFELAQVRYSTIDNIKDVITPAFNEVIQLNNLTVNVEFI